MKTHQWTRTLILAAGAWSAAGQTAVDLSRQGKVGTGTILPTHCTVGQIFFNTDAPPGTNLFACTTPNGWVAVGLPILGGDATGTQPSVTVRAIQGHAVSAAAPADQNVLRWNAATGQWGPGMVPATGAAAPPATCVAGSLYLRSDATNNIQQLYVCSNTNTWAMASARSGPAANRPPNCVTGQTWLSTDTGAMTYCSVTGSPGTWNAALAGPQGPAGANGNTLLSGAGVPLAGTGSNGDFYLNTAANCLYGPRASGNWPGSCTSLVGPQGPQGLAGTAPVWTTVAFSSTPTFAVSAPIQGFQMTLTGNVTSSAFSGTLQSGQLVIFKVCQGPGGGRTFAPPSNVVGFGPLDPAANACNTQTFQHDGANLTAIAPLRSDNLTATGQANLPQISSTLTNPTTGNDANYRRGWELSVTTDGATSNPAYSNEVGAAFYLRATNGQGAYSSQTRSKKTFVPLSVSGLMQGSGQKFNMTRSLVCTGMSDCALDSSVVQFAGGPIAGDEVSGGFSSISYLKQQGSLSHNEVTAASRGTCNTTTTQPITASVIAYLTADITAGSTVLTVAAENTGWGKFANGNYALIDSEYVLLSSGALSGTWTVVRAQLGTTAAPHAKTSIAAQVQTITVADSGSCHPGEWAVIGQDVNDGGPNIGLTQLVGVGSGSITGIFLNNQLSGVTVTPALVLDLRWPDNSLGQDRVLVNLSGASYSAGKVASIAGGGFTGDGAGGQNWTPGMVGGSATNIGVISLDADDYTASPFDGSNGPLKSWYEISSTPATTTMAILSMSVAGDRGYHGKGPGTGGYIIRPGARVLRIVGQTVILESTTTVWNAGDIVELAICPYPDLSGYSWNIGSYTPGGIRRSFFGVNNNGARAFESVLSITDHSMATASNADTYGFGSIITSSTRTGIGAILIDGPDLSGMGMRLKSYSNLGDHKWIQWWEASPVGTGVSFSLGWDGSRGTSGQQIWAWQNGRNYMDFAASGDNHTWAWPNKSGTVAMLSDTGYPGVLTRTIPGPVNDAVDLGAFATASPNYSGDYVIDIAANDGVACSLAKSYKISAAASSGGWQIVAPLSANSAGGAFDFDLDINASGPGGPIAFRIRRTVGTHTATALINLIETAGAGAFTASTATSSVSAPTTYYSTGGLWPLSLSIGKTPSIAATLDPSSLSASRAYKMPDMGGTVGLVLAGTTGSIGGGALAAGACASGAVNIAGATTGMAVAVSPSGGADPTNGNNLGVVWEGYVSAPNTVTVKVCAPVAGTPAAAVYNVRVIQ